MTKKELLLNLIKDKDYRWIYFGRRGWFNFMPDEIFLKKKYWHQLHEKLELDNPRTFNEKLQWLKLNDRRKEYIQMVDKAGVKDFVASKIGEEHIIPTLGIYDRFDDIDFDALPDKFVMKCTHDSSSTIICTDKNTFDFKNAKKKFDYNLKAKYYLKGREWPYKYVKPRIIIEKFMVDESGTELKDYKFFCYNGELKYFKVDYNRYTNHRANYYTTDYKLMTYCENEAPYDESIPFVKPENFEEMMAIAEKLSVGIPFLRVDLYNINGHIYFGELTLYPSSGFSYITPPEWNYTLGDWIKLPPKTT